MQHHLIDVLEPNSEVSFAVTAWAEYCSSVGMTGGCLWMVQEVFTAGRFLEKAEEAVQDVWARGKLPMIVGGTSMYTQWLVQGKPDAPRYSTYCHCTNRGERGLPTDPHGQLSTSR